MIDKLTDVIYDYHDTYDTIYSDTVMLSVPCGKTLLTIDNDTRIKIISLVVYDNTIWLKIYHDNKFGYILSSECSKSNSKLMKDIDYIETLLKQKETFGNQFIDTEREKSVSIEFSDIIGLDSRYIDEIDWILSKYMNKKYGHSRDYDSDYVDCSGLTLLIYGDMGIEVTWSASSQANDLISQGGIYIYNSQTDGENSQSVFDNCQFGDLITFNEGGHVGIYIGDGYFIHSATGAGVEIRGYYSDEGYLWANQQSIYNIVRPNWNQIK